MAITASVGELVQIQFPVFDIDGITPMSGLVDTDFAKLLLRDNTISPIPMTISEVASSGRYVLAFVPNVDGLWYAEVQTPVEDIFADQVEVGPPPDDWLDAIAAAVWEVLLPGTFPAGSAGDRLGNVKDEVWGAPLPAAYPADSAGERLASTDVRVQQFHEALIMARLTAAAGSSATLVKTNAGKPDDFYNGLTVVFRNAAGNVARRVVDYSATDGTFTVPALPFTPAAGDDVVVLGILGEVAIAPDTDLFIRLVEIHRLLGLDAEYPLCITKTYQEVDGFRLVHTEVGNKLIVRREDL